MTLQNGLFTLALSALLLAPAARAEDWGVQHEASPVAGGYGAERFHGNGGYRPAPMPPPAQPSRSQWPREQGRYELQTVQRWVPGHYEQVWVGERCDSGRRYIQRCVQGHYEQRWMEGYHQSVQEWVWVPFRSRRGPYAVADGRW